MNRKTCLPASLPPHPQRVRLFLLAFLLLTGLALSNPARSQTGANGAVCSVTDVGVIHDGDYSDTVNFTWSANSPNDGSTATYTLILVIDSVTDANGKPVTLANTRFPVQTIGPGPADVVNQKPSFQLNPYEFLSKAGIPNGAKVKYHYEIVVTLTDAVKPRSKTYTAAASSKSVSAVYRDILIAIDEDAINQAIIAQQLGDWMFSHFAPALPDILANGKL